MTPRKIRIASRPNAGGVPLFDVSDADGNRIEGVCSFTYRADANGVPVVTLEIHAMFADVRIDTAGMLPA